MSEKVTELKVVKVTARGLARIPDTKEGATFIVDSWTQRWGTTTPDMIIYHVRDYRYAAKAWGDFCIWSLAPGDYEEVKL